MLAPGNVIGGRYRLVRLLGEGGMGTVWAAVNEAFGREVAVKVMLRDVAAEPTAIERFLTEARICGAIRHPGIVDVLDVGQTQEGAPFLVMELLDGEAIDTILRRAGTLRPLDLLPVVRDVARTLALAHERGVIHRDIKPGNVYLHRLPNGQIVAKVLDFGISKVTEKSAQPATMTQSGTVVGSPAYMSPEQAAGRVELDPRSDVYSLGVIMYEALAGRLPFLEPNYNALIIDIAVKEPPPLGSLVSGLPRPVLDLVKAAMAHERDQRVASANALADKVEATLAALGAAPTLALPDPAALGSASITGARAARSSASARAIIRTRRASGWRSAMLAFSAVLVVGGGGIGLKLYTQRARAATPPPAVPSGDPTAAATPAATGAASPGASTAPAATAEPPVPPASASASAATTPAGMGSATPPRASAGKGPAGKGKKKGGVWGYD